MADVNEEIMAGPDWDGTFRALADIGGPQFYVAKGCGVVVTDREQHVKTCNHCKALAYFPNREVPRLPNA